MAPSATNLYQLPLTFEQILGLVRQLPEPDRLKLAQTIEKERRAQKLTQVLEACRTDELSLDTITQEVEAVRAKMHEERQAK